MTEKRMIDWYLSFTDEQKKLVDEIRIAANDFIKSVPPETSENENRKAAFIAGFILGFSEAGGELPLEPPTEN